VGGQAVPQVLAFEEKDLSQTELLPGSASFPLVRIPHAHHTEWVKEFDLRLKMDSVLLVPCFWDARLAMVPASAPIS